MPLLQLTSDDPSASFELTYADKSYLVIRYGKQWQMFNDEKIRIGVGSLHWTGALRRAVEQLERNGK